MEKLHLHAACGFAQEHKRKAVERSLRELYGIKVWRTLYQWLFFAWLFSHLQQAPDSVRRLGALGPVRWTVAVFHPNKQRRN